MWHTRLGEAALNGFQARLRALADLPDRFPAGTLTSLTAQNRDDIVTRSKAVPSRPDVITSSGVLLTALGASAELKSDWPNDASTTLAAWRHDVTLGRDRYVRTVELGFLFPFGLRASLETITQRTTSFSQPVRIAPLVQSSVLTVQDTERNYLELKDRYTSKGLEMPFRRIQIAPSLQTVPDANGVVQLSVTAEDRAGNFVIADMVMLFVSLAEAGDTQKLNDLATITYPQYSTVLLNDQHVALAEDPTGQNATSLAVDKLVFGVQFPATTGALGSEPPFLPYMISADVSLPAIRQMLGTVGTVPSPTKMRLHSDYLSGFQAGDKKLIFGVFDTPLPALSIPAERAGGLATPRFPQPDGLSCLMGPVSNVKLPVDVIQPQDLVGDAQLLGSIALKQIIEAIPADAPAFLAKHPELAFAAVDTIGNVLPRPVLTTVASPTGIETRFVWKPQVKRTGLPQPLTLLAPPADPMELVIKGRVVSQFSTSGSVASAPVYEVTGKLSNFAIDFPGFLRVEFDAIDFTSGAGQKTDLTTNIRAVVFESNLNFVDTIRKLLPVGNLGPAPQVEPQPDGVVIQYVVAVPSFAATGFSIQNISLASSVSLPFVPGKPFAVRFALSERNNPFLVSISIFGGTGFFAVETRTDGYVLVEAAIEFGGALSLNLLGIISGGVHVLAGIYVRITSTITGTDTSITGQLRIGGFVDVLGLISVAIEVVVGLTYDSNGGTLSGDGRLTVSVKILFFSQSFSFTVHKEIAGFGAPPNERMALRFAQARGILQARAPDITLQQWQTYCRAFA
jgi:hypothetical protein